MQKLITELLDKLESGVGVCSVDNLDFLYFNKTLEEWFNLQEKPRNLADCLSKTDFDRLQNNIIKKRAFRFEQTISTRSRKETIEFVAKITEFSEKISYLIIQGSINSSSTKIKNIISNYDIIFEKNKNELLKEKENAEASSREKSAFLSRMSHELRTPLNAIIGFSSIMKRHIDHTTPANIVKSNDHILQAGRHLLFLVEDIFELSNSENSEIEISLTNVDFDAAVEASFNLVSNEAQTRNITLFYENTNLYILANAHRLRQVLVNLLMNAIKYNHQRGSVTVRAKVLAQEQIEITVEDTGVGIEPNEKETVFAPFSRLTYATKNEIDGVGIGLTLCKFLVEQMNGNIGFNQALERGTVFFVRLPQAEAGELNIPLKRDHFPKSTGLSRSVLYIEDNRISRELLEIHLADFPGIKLVTAHTAKTGIEIAKTIRPDVIFIDINLPDISGVDALRIMKNDPIFHATRMIALSADAMPEQIEYAMNAGFDQYLTKPVDLDEVVKSIEDPE